MSRRHIPGWLFAILSGWLMAEIVILWPRLPQRLATHFGFSGEPNGWSTPSQFLIMMATAYGIFVLLFTMAAWLDRVPDRFLNLPNKGYWLATDRRAQALGTLREWLRWFLVVTFAGLVVLMRAMLQANLGGTASVHQSPSRHRRVCAAADDPDRLALPALPGAARSLKCVDLCLRGE